jgi:8-oxo-dGTP diphosphatase
MILNSVSVDCVIFGFDNSGLRVLLNQIDKDALKLSLPEQVTTDQIKELYEQHPVLTSDHYWSLFGSHVPENQDLDEFAKSLLFQATGVNNVFLQQIHTFGSLERVPYTRVITIGYYALINPDYYHLKQSGLAKSLQWFNLNEIMTKSLNRRSSN